MSTAMSMCLIFAALGLGVWIGERGAHRKPRPEKQSFRYWRP